MAGLGYKGAFTTDASNFRLGRNTVKRDRSANFRSWLQAAIRRIANYVGFSPSSRHSDAEFPLMIAHRTHADEPWTAAYDPLRN